jgi:hypothetical protein
MVIECVICGEPCPKRARRFCGHDCMLVEKRSKSKSARQKPLGGTCERCDEPLGPLSNRFCTQQCSWLAIGEAARKARERSCPQCCQVFIAKDHEQKFCSHSCSASFNNLGRQGVRTGPPKQPRPPCEKCGLPCQSHGTRFCSKGCSLGWPAHVKTGDQYVEAWLRGEVSGAIANNEGLTLPVDRYMRSLRGPACWQCGWCEVNPTTGHVPTCIDHIDGDHTNNQFDNLRLLCPNCHSLTPTYGSLNTGRGRPIRRKRAKEAYFSLLTIAE